jgi:CHAT domain-containing protein/tetratricopeptide (TPR) repeat protein
MPIVWRVPKRLAFGLLLAFSLIGCKDMPVAPSDNFKLMFAARHVMKQEHYRIIAIYQPRLDQQQQLKCWELYILANAYYEVRDFNHLFPVLDRMDQRIAQGDVLVPDSPWGTDISMAPGMFRGAAHLDLGDPATAEKELAEAYALLVSRLGEQPEERVAGAGFPVPKKVIKKGGLQSPTDVMLHLAIPSYLGVAHALQGHDPEAEKCIRTLEGTFVAPSWLSPQKKLDIAKVHMARKQFGKALAAVRTADARAEGAARMEALFTNSTFSDLNNLYILSKCLYETGDSRNAKSGFDRLLEHPRIKEIGGLYWPVLLDRARIARREGQDPLAEKLLTQAVEVVERQRASIHSEAGRIGFVGDKQAVYEEAVSLQVSLDRPAAAFAYVERAKGRALVDLLAAQNRLLPPSSQEDSLASTLMQLGRAEQDAAVTSDPAGGAAPERTRGIAVTLRQQLAQGAPELASLVMVTGTSVPELQARIGPDETLLEYYASGPAWYAFVVTRDAVRVASLPAIGLDQQVIAARRAFTQPRSEDAAQAARALYDALFKPVAAQVRTANLIIVPHGVLHYVPFGALGDGDHCLIDRYNLRILPSASVLRFLRSGKGLDRVLILGNPDLGDPAFDLAYAQDEALAIAREFPGATVLLRDKATATFIREQGAHFDLLHFAAHGTFDVDKPLDSALLLAKDARSDGTLRVGDLYHLALDADLVTLSACETALSKVANGDDVVGFTRGLLYAGSRSILSSLWKVDDQATRDLMVTFYQGLATHSKAEALRLAQLEVRKQRPHPYYWAGFMLTGSGR